MIVSASEYTVDAGQFSLFEIDLLRPTNAYAISFPSILCSRHFGLAIRSFGIANRMMSANAFAVLHAQMDTLYTSRVERYCFVFFASIFRSERREQMQRLSAKFLVFTLISCSQVDSFVSNVQRFSVCFLRFSFFLVTSSRRKRQYLRIAGARKVSIE